MSQVMNTAWEVAVWALQVSDPQASWSVATACGVRMLRSPGLQGDPDARFGQLQGCAVPFLVGSQALTEFLSAAVL